MPNSIFEVETLRLPQDVWTPGVIRVTSGDLQFDFSCDQAVFGRALERLKLLSSEISSPADTFRVSGAITWCRSLVPVDNTTPREEYAWDEFDDFVDEEDLLGESVLGKLRAIANEDESEEEEPWDEVVLEEVETHRSLRQQWLEILKAKEQFLAEQVRAFAQSEMGQQAYLNS